MAIDPFANTLIRGHPTSPAQASALARQFMIGQTLKGIVLRTLPEGQTLVNFAGQHILLDLAQPMVRGQTFMALVEQVSPTLILKLVDSAPPLIVNTPEPPATPQAPTPERGTVEQTPTGTLNAAQLKPYLVAKQPLGDMVAALQRALVRNPPPPDIDAGLLHRLQETLTALLPLQEEPPDAASLRAQVDRSGINYEAKVQEVLTKQASPVEQAALANDLKGQLLELLHKLDQRPSPAASLQHDAPMGSREPGQPALTQVIREGTRSGDIVDLREHVQQALRNIEFQQLSNLFAHQQHQPLLLQFAHPAFPAAHTAKLYFRVDTREQDAQQDAQQNYTLVFLLDFSALGPVRVDATVRGAYVSTTISTTDEAVADFITAQTPDLTARLHALGFQAEVRCSAQVQVSLDVDDSLTRLLVAEPSRLVDVKT
jgi:hypothetical protein